MADEFSNIIIEMMKTPPDPSEPIPLSNQKATMFGVTIPFHVCYFTERDEIKANSCRY
jgi:hypothetical protein